MWKIFLEIFGILGLSFLLLRLVVPERIYTNWAKVNKIRLFFLILLILLMSIIYLIYYHGINRNITKNQVMEILQNLENNKIKSIKIYKSTNQTSEAIDTLFITNDSLKMEFAKTLKYLEFENPAFTYSVFNYNVEILVENHALDDIKLRVIKNEYLLYYLWVTRKTRYIEYNLGSYKCKEFGILLEKVVL